MRQGERRIHTRSHLVCKDLGCLEPLHKCWSLGECSRLGEIQLEQGRRCERVRQGERRIHTRSHLVCKDLGCLEPLHKCWSLGECSRLGEIEGDKVSRYFEEEEKLWRRYAPLRGLCSELEWFCTSTYVPITKQIIIATRFRV